MKVHEMQSLDFSEALSRLDEKLVATKLALDNAKERVIEIKDADVLGTLLFNPNFCASYDTQA